MSKSTSEGVWRVGQTSVWLSQDNSPLYIVRATLVIERNDRHLAGEDKFVAGPFESLDAAKAAYIILKGAYGG